MVTRTRETEKWKQSSGSVALNSLSLEATLDMFTYTWLASSSHMALSQLQRQLGNEELMDMCWTLADLIPQAVSYSGQNPSFSTGTCMLSSMVDHSYYFFIPDKSEIVIYIIFFNRQNLDKKEARIIFREWLEHGSNLRISNLCCSLLFDIRVVWVVILDLSLELYCPMW